MKSVAKITVFLMAVTALEASRLGSPTGSKVSGDLSSGVVWTCCVVVVFVFVIVVVALYQPSSKQIADCQSSNYQLPMSPLTHQFYHSFTQTASNKVQGVKTQLVDGPDIMSKGVNKDGSNDSALPEPEARPEVSGTSGSAPPKEPAVPGPDASEESKDAGGEPSKAKGKAKASDSAAEELTESGPTPGEGPKVGPKGRLEGPAPSEPQGPLGRAL
jgi:hypothetical protein